MTLPRHGPFLIHNNHIEKLEIKMSKNPFPGNSSKNIEASAATSPSAEVLLIPFWLLNAGTAKKLLAVAWKRIERNPCEGIKKLKENGLKERFLSPDEVRKILAAALVDMNVVAGHAVRALILTGLRREEILQSRHEHLDLEKRVLYLPHTKSGRSRHVVLNDAAVDVFKSVPRMPGSPWIFYGKDPMKPLNNPTKAWHRILDVALVKRCRLHNCRHTFASMLVNEGASLFLVQQLLGHASSVTTQRYAHLASSTLRNTSQLVSNLVNQTQP